MKALTWRHPNTEVRDSPIQGKGLFASEPFHAGDVVAVKGGYVLDGRDWNKLEPILGAAEIQIADDLFIAPFSEREREGCMVYSNHSCDPNIEIQGQIVFVASREIAAGEELTHDWATTDDADYEMVCRCGSPDCRGTITGKDWTRPELQKKYAGRFCWFLQRKIDALNSGPG